MSNLTTNLVMVTFFIISVLELILLVNIKIESNRKALEPHYIYLLYEYTYKDGENKHSITYLYKNRGTLVSTFLNIDSLNKYVHHNYSLPCTLDFYDSSSNIPRDFINYTGDRIALSVDRIIIK